MTANKKRVLVINHQDSFVHNLVQIIREYSECKYTFIDSKELSEGDSLLREHEYLLFSPGPGHPSEFPYLIPTIQRCAETHSILGVCLGMQAIAIAFGGDIICLPEPKHGHKSRLFINNDNNILFRDLLSPISIGRYHSWGVSESTLPDELSIDAYDEDNNIAALSHRSLRIWGVQFHPESVITEYGREMIYNWLAYS